jgi:NTP pyrophosphatase (non-canonical NTP hydrolase)
MAERKDGLQLAAGIRSSSIKEMDPKTRATAAVLQERKRQHELHGVQVLSLTQWASLIAEEAGEVAKAANDSEHDGAPLALMLEELVQLSALALQASEALIPLVDEEKVKR